MKSKITLLFILTALFVSPCAAWQEDIRQQEVKAELQAAADDFEAGKLDDAIKKIDALRAKDPNILSGHLVVASWFAQMNNERAMRQMVEAYITKHPDDPESYVFMADFNLQNGNIIEAELLYKHAALTLQSYHTNTPRNLILIRRYRLGMAQVDVARERWTEAVKKLEVFFRTNMDSPEVKDKMKEILDKILENESPFNKREDAEKMRKKLTEPQS